MPVFILWAVPAVLVIGGGIYLIGHCTRPVIEGERVSACSAQVRSLPSLTRAEGRHAARRAPAGARVAVQQVVQEVRCDEEYLQPTRNDFRPAHVFHTLPSRKPDTGCAHGPATGPEHQREGRR